MDWGGHMLEMCRWMELAGLALISVTRRRGHPVPSVGGENLSKPFLTSSPPHPQLPPSGVDEVRDHVAGVWPPVSLIPPLSLAHTCSCTTACSLCLSFLPRACRYKYEENAK